ncbi:MULTISPECIES: antibiotic biosynthesis monooxygenase family protein [Subtercola]|uniref:Antibiotic biosynthesis monooxygenase n=1 Tax=Subtercola vilae TaxID=2056433 RepID=A0A4T2C4I3_9MICO|nr:MULTISPECIES: antibiotic biosynthesis monooxygenase [Subtercola]MEA9985088.1 antibiotic biosynthesis monooxygenase [Subtercola sp. RTI3]TIH37108.1 antibiotic biosynthesis monooxygenase [Subtercola vilae]
MSVVKINAISVPAQAGAELEKRFAARARAVDGFAGFEGFQLLRPVKGESRYFVVTTWDTEENFQAWLSSQSMATHGSGATAPAGHGAATAAGSAPHAAPAHEGGSTPGHGGSAKPVATGAELLEFEVVDLSAAS